MLALGTGRTEVMHTKRQLQKWSKAKLIREIIKLESVLLRIAIKFYKLFKDLGIIRDLEEKIDFWDYNKLNEVSRVALLLKEKMKQNGII